MNLYGYARSNPLTYTDPFGLATNPRDPNRFQLGEEINRLKDERPIAMDDREVQSLVTGCLRYVHASKLPMPLPTNPLDYAEWREKASEEPDVGEDAEDAWFELDRLLADEPDVGWKVLIELASRCEDEDVCAHIAAGPLTTFLHAHREAFACQIEEELMQNAGFRTAFNWLRG